MTGIAAVAGSARIAWQTTQAVDAGQHQVEHDEVGGLRAQPRHDARSRREPFDHVPRLFEVMGDQRRDVVVVFDDENPRHSKSSSVS